MEQILHLKKGKKFQRKDKTAYVKSKRKCSQPKEKSIKIFLRNVLMINTKIMASSHKKMFTQFFYFIANKKSQICHKTFV